MIECSGECSGECSEDGSDGGDGIEARMRRDRATGSSDDGGGGEEAGFDEKPGGGGGEEAGFDEKPGWADKRIAVYYPMTRVVLCLGCWC